MFRLFSLVFLLVIPGICSKEWDVQYPNPEKCALKGSSIFLSSIYKHPAHLTVTEIFWTVNPVKGGGQINLSDHPDYKGRVEYFHKKDLSTFNLKLSNVTHEDERMYCIGIVTKVEDQKFLGFPGVDLKVTELRVEVPEEVVEKYSAVLFCNTTCDLVCRNLIWCKNGKLLPQFIGMKQLVIPSVSSEDAGKYSCAVRDQKHLSSPEVNLDVRYPPRSVSVSVSGSAEIVEGRSVRLICSSDSNPPAEIHWIKGSSFLGSGRTYSFTNISSKDSGNYSCSAGNKHGSQTSAAVILNVMYPPRNVSVSVSGSSEVLEGDSVRLICSSDSNPPALTFSWFQENHTSAVGSGQSFSISSFNSSLSGRFYCEAHNKYGSQRSHAVSLSVKESSSSWLRLSVGVSGSAVVMSVMLMGFIFHFRQQRHNKKVESENIYMTLDPTSRRSEYDTLDNMKRSLKNTDVPEDQESSYYNINR